MLINAEQNSGIDPNVDALILIGIDRHWLALGIDRRSPEINVSKRSFARNNKVLDFQPDARWILLIWPIINTKPVINWQSKHAETAMDIQNASGH